MIVTLINPNLVFQRNDPFTTGIVYMPVSLAYVAAALRSASIDVRVVDAFGEAPEQCEHDGAFSRLGLSFDQVVARVAPQCDVVIVYAINLTNHLSTVGIVKALRTERPDVRIVVLENAQAVTAYGLKDVAHEFYAAGAEAIITGEGERRALALIKAFRASSSCLAAIDGVGTPTGFTPPAGNIDDLDALPFPAWDLFPLANYWRVKFAHGPFTSERYLPLLTSRGCPYPCTFCVVPATNKMRWRARSATNVVDEMAFWQKALGVSEFHIEDLNPTVKDTRTREISHEILKRELKVSWKLVAGTKVETMKDESTVDLMAKAGCAYISISPETGSSRLLREMRKPFDLEHAVKLVKRMNRVGIRCQACFVLGYPGETDEDRNLTLGLVRNLTREGVDEIAVFIITPVPGSDIFPKLTGYGSLSQLNFTPTWRADYEELIRWRLRLYKEFLFLKLRHYPGKVARQTLNFMTRRFETKMEMVPYRAFVLKFVWGWERRS